jgi:hypothetical protein
MVDYQLLTTILDMAIALETGDIPLFRFVPDEIWDATVSP